jgi:hypothetical protein
LGRKEFIMCQTCSVNEFIFYICMCMEGASILMQRGHLTALHKMLRHSGESVCCSICLVRSKVNRPMMYLHKKKLKAGNLTTINEPVVCKMWEAWHINPVGLHRSVTGIALTFYGNHECLVSYARTMFTPCTGFPSVSIWKIIWIPPPPPLQVMKSTILGAWASALLGLSLIVLSYAVY